MNLDERDPTCVPDPLRRDVRAELAEELPVLGIPVRFETDDARVLDVVRATFGAWRGLARYPRLVGAERVLVRCLTHSGDEGGRSPIPVSYRMPDRDRLLIHTPGSTGMADFRRRESVAWVTPDLVSARPLLGRDVLSALTLFHLAYLDRHPVHAAAVERDGSVVLLAGPSGVGKSTLAYARLRRGDRFLSDDVVFVQTEPEWRVWGLPGTLSLDARARGRFPELAGRSERRDRDGRSKIGVDAVADRLCLEPPAAATAGVCILVPGEGPSLARITTDEVVEHLTSSAETGFDLFAATAGRVAGWLGRHGGWRLTPGARPEEAAPLLEDVHAEVRARNGQEADARRP